MTQSLILFLKGLAMGAANVIPGVSGGTIALVTGIYEKFIHSLKSLDLAAIQLLLKGKFQDFWSHINGTFLTMIFAGIGVSLFTLAKFFKFLLENENPNYSIWLMAFFFGLILASIYFVGKTVSQWNVVNILMLVLGTALAVWIALLNPAMENTAWWYLLVCGVVAMCSMILPGLSGSFVLILMGNYKLIMLDAVSELKLDILIPVAVGAVAGLIAFSRILSWVFKYYKNQTIALMTGFILGSLLTIWPWKNEIPLLDEAGNPLMKEGKTLISGYDWFMPELGESGVIIAFVLVLVSALSIWGIEVAANKTAKEA